PARLASRLRMAVWNWKDLVDAIPENFLNKGPQQPRTIAALRAINPKFVAVGHGPCFICK
ncbi:MAG: hypothetical protein IJV18_11455, partial [Acidaminococcaceae bacterium]|nr:hypothetical protein [Acidaminococcaceae bacterium]